MKLYIVKSSHNTVIIALVIPESTSSSNQKYNAVVKKGSEEYMIEAPQEEWDG